MAYTKTNWINDVTEVDETNMNHIEDGIEKAYGVILLAVVDTAPSECSVGDKYFNTTTNKIYEATDTDTWDTEGYDAESGVFYVVFSERAIYTYNGTTLVGVGSSGAGGESLPVGSIIAFAGSTAPEGYLMCDGSIVSRTANNDLFNVIGTTYGQGDGSTTFGVPNIKGKVLVMLDTSQTEFDTLGETGGNKVAFQYSRPALNSYSFIAGSGAYGDRMLVCKTSTSSSIEQDFNISSLQPYIVVNYIIKAHPSAVNTSEVVNEHSDSETNVYSANYVNHAIKDIYSTDEVKTNKVWEDGKPIYRKVFTFSSLDNSSDNIIGTISNVDTMLPLCGNANEGGVILSLPYSDYRNIEWNIGLCFNTDDGQVIVRKGGFGTITGTSKVIVEYTKNNQTN